MLEEQGIEFDNIITMKTAYESNREESTKVAAGYTFFYFYKESAHAAVSIEREMLTGKSDLDKEDYEYLNDIRKYLALIHEIAHVKDFRLKRNINWVTGKTDLIKAEIFAEISTLKYLTKNSSIYNKYARKLYSERLIDYLNCTDIYHREIAMGVTKKLTLKKLKQWATAI